MARTSRLAAYLYLHLAEPMPAPVLDDNGVLDVARDNAQLQAWSAAASTVEFDTSRLARFLDETRAMLVRLEQLELDPSEPAPAQYMTLFYDAAKATFDHDKTQLRTYFLWLYLVLFQKPDGPRWGDFVDIYGRAEFVAFAHAQFKEYFNAA